MSWMACECPRRRRRMRGNGLGHVNEVRVIEVIKGKDGKLYPPRMPLPKAARNRLRWMIHALVCRDGLPLRAAQKVMREQYGVRRSLGQLHYDLKNFECPRCVEPPARPVQPTDQAQGDPAHVHQARSSSWLTGMITSDG